MKLLRIMNDTTAEEIEATESTRGMTYLKKK
jgi:hypothetical protein